MTSWPWILRALTVIPAFSLFAIWHGIGAPWAAFLMWLVCTSGAELIIEVSRRANERRRTPSRPLRGGRRRTDPPL